MTLVNYLRSLPKLSAATVSFNNSPENPNSVIGKEGYFNASTYINYLGGHNCTKIVYPFPTIILTAIMMSTCLHKCSKIYAFPVFIFGQVNAGAWWLQRSNNFKSCMRTKSAWHQLYIFNKYFGATMWTQINPSTDVCEENLQQLPLTITNDKDCTVKMRQRSPGYYRRHFLQNTSTIVSKILTWDWISHFVHPTESTINVDGLNKTHGSNYDVTLLVVALCLSMCNFTNDLITYIERALKLLTTQSRSVRPE